MDKFAIVDTSISSYQNGTPEQGRATERLLEFSTLWRMERMFAASLLIALSHAVSTVSPSPQWQTDYAKALRMAKDAQKSLVVVVGKGDTGWSKLSKTGSLSLEARKLLVDRYVCLYVDAEKSANDRLARDFDVSQFPTLVVSDKSGSFQVHRQSGRADDQVLESNLRRYVAYEMHQPVVHQSYYQPAGSFCRG